jgi:signal transduction histidine kinase
MTLHARTAQRHLAAAGLPAEHPVSVEVDQLHALTQAALAEMRALIFELRPGALEAEGLASALGKQAAALAAREQLPVEVHAPAERLSIPPKVEEHVYRLVLEALHNAVRHAEAHRLDVWLATLPDGGLEVRVVDDGVGFDPAVPHPGHLGLHTMRDRAEAVRGVLDVVSRPGHGTEVRLTVPLHH